MIILIKIKKYFKFSREFLINFLTGVTLSSIFCEIIINKSKNDKVKKKFLIKSIKSFQLKSQNDNDLFNLNVFSENLKYEIKKKINPSNKSIFFLKHIMLYHLWFGSFANSQYVRNLYRENIISYQKNKDILDLNAVRAVIEVNRLNLLKEWIKHKNFSKQDKKLSKIFLNYLKITSNEKLSDLELSKMEMIDLVKDKKVIVIGPAPDDEFKSDDLYKKFDVSVGPNYVCDRDTKFNISYYVALIKKVKTDLIYNSFKKLDFACVASQYYKLIDLSKIENSNVRSFEEELLSLMLIFKSRPNLIQDIIYDLLKHNPRKIYLCGTNFFLGKKTYRDNSFTKYIDNERKKDGVIKTLRLHDPFANFAFLKNVWTNGLIDVSEDLKSVISLSEEDFSIKLDNLSNTNFN